MGIFRKNVKLDIRNFDFEINNYTRRLDPRCHGDDNQCRASISPIPPNPPHEACAGRNYKVVRI